MNSLDHNTSPTEIEGLVLHTLREHVDEKDFLEIEEDIVRMIKKGFENQKFSRDWD
jgi:hypothetical protein